MNRRPTLSTTIRQRLDRLSKAERKVAYALLANYPMAGLETVARFAERTGTSGPTVIRFVHRLGFDGYRGFQDALRRELSERLEGPLARYPGSRAVKVGEALNQRVGDTLCANIQTAIGCLPADELSAVIALLCDPNRDIYLLGGRFSGMIAGYLYRYLRELRAGVSAIKGNSAEWGDQLLDVKSGDVAVIFDFRRYQHDVLTFARVAARQHACIVLITDVWRSPVAPLAWQTLCCPVEIPSVFDSGVAALAMAEVLVAGAVERLGEPAKQRIARLESLREALQPEIVE